MSRTPSTVDAAPSAGTGRRRIWIAAAVLLVVVALAVFVLPAFLDVERHRGRIERALRDATGWEAELGAIDLSVLRGLAVEVSPAHLVAPGGDSRIDIARVAIRAALRPLLGGRLVIERVELVEPAIHIVRPGTERGWQLPLPDGGGEGPTNGGEGSSSAVSVRRVVIRDGNLRLEDRSVEPPATFRLQQVELELLAGTGEIDGSGALADAGGRISVGGTLWPLALEFEMAATPLETALELTEALFPLGLDVRPPGTVRLVAELDMPAGGELTYEARGEVSAARFRAAEVLPDAQDLRAAFHLNREGSLDLRILEGTVGGGPLEGRITLDSIDPLGTLVYDGGVDGASLGTLLGALVTDASGRVVGPAAVRGRVAIDLGEPQLDATALQGTVDLAAIDVSLSGWDLESALRQKLRERLGKLAKVAALVDPDVARALEEPEDGPQESRRLLDKLSGRVSFDSVPWQLAAVELQTGGVSALGEGVLDPLTGKVDLALAAKLDPELTRGTTARHPRLGSLVDDRGELTLPMRLRGSLVQPEVDLDLAALLPAGLSETGPEQAVRGLLDGLLKRKSSEENP